MSGHQPWQPRDVIRMLFAKLRLHLEHLDGKEAAFLAGADECPADC